MEMNVQPISANFSLFRMAPVATFMLSLVARAVVPFFYYGMVLSDPNIGLQYLFTFSIFLFSIIISNFLSLYYFHLRIFCSHFISH
ncbi:LOW QUALITY PROTEIN: NADH-ubiquinone oxidoreductase chain 1 [Castanea sativa]|uniref:LOW QUALITY PROTEIN: NADH-ubiquinone oxidoreductase chain 1 n=1 Tax=Castanea sativa TaxID=21020 RepID=UPI003F649E3A